MSDVDEEITPRLLLADTDEPLQPVRLYYSVKKKKALIKRLRRLDMFEAEPARGRWAWWEPANHSHVAAAMVEATPPDHEIVEDLGYLRFPASGGMSFDLPSVQAAIDGAKLVEKELGAMATLRRCRVVNRFFGEGDGDLDTLMKTLDRDVTITDEVYAREGLLASLLEEMTREKAVGLFLLHSCGVMAHEGDVPLVEDFPLRVERDREDTQLDTILTYRKARAYMRWHGEPELTLREVVQRAMRLLHEEGEALS